MKELDGVLDACVVGAYDEIQGEDIIFAFILKAPTNESLTENEILQYFNGRIDDDAKQLRGGVRFVETFPLTHTEKIKRVEMRRIAQEYYKRCKY